MNFGILLHPWFGMGVGLLLLAIFIHWYLFPLQYFFHLRYQFLTALTLATYPWFTSRIFPNILNNTLVLTSGIQIFVVTFLAILTAWVAMYTTFLFLHHRNRLIKESDVGTWQRWLTPGTRPSLEITRSVLERWRNLAFALLALPLIYAIYHSSITEASYEKAVGIVAAVLLAVLGDWLTRRITLWRAERRKTGRQTTVSPALDGVSVQAQPPITRQVTNLPPGLKEGFLTQPMDSVEGDRVAAVTNVSHTGATVYVLLTLIVYTLGFIFLNPQSPNPFQAEVPALAYVLLLLIIAGWILPFLAFFFDYFRIPVVLLIGLLSFWIANLSDTDHYYELTTADAASHTDVLTLEGLIKIWADKHAGDNDPIVVVTASGGGIASAVWTTQVLTGIQQRLTQLGQEADIADLGDRFGRGILFITGASGGSVGAMYYVDAFQNGNPPDAQALPTIVDAAAAPSLAATAWGIAYTDIWSSLASSLLPRNFVRDRGWAMEQSWASQLRQQDATFGSWRHDILNNNWRPAVLFNSTIVEDGGLMLLTPVQMLPRTDYGATYYQELYSAYDIRVVTAARMSATFPYVSPIARPIYDGAFEAPSMADKHYHLADGGYHDNFGIVPALIWLKEVVAPQAAQRGRKILIIEIRLSSPDATRLPSKENVAWLYSVAGPPLTLVNIWSSTQVNRGGLDYALLKDAFQDQVAIKKVTFFPLAGGCPPILIPLSWQISVAQRDALFCMWDKSTNRTEKVLEIMDFFLSENGNE